MLCGRLLEINQDLPLPPGYTDEELATMFNNSFITTIAEIKEVLESACMDTIQTSDCCTHYYQTSYIQDTDLSRCGEDH